MDTWFYASWEHLTPTTNANDTSCDKYFFVSVNQMEIWYNRSLDTAFDYEARFPTAPTFNGLVCESNYLMVDNILVDFMVNTTKPSATINETTFRNAARPVPPTIFNSTKMEDYLLATSLMYQLSLSGSSGGTIQGAFSSHGGEGWYGSMDIFSLTRRYVVFVFIKFSLILESTVTR